MATRGRKSAAALSVATATSLGERPSPPLSLNSRATDEWLRVVNRMPSDWFGAETLSLLQAHCEHVAECEAVQMMIEKVRKTAMKNDVSYARYRDLLRAKELQTRAMLSCATKMRLTQQSTYTPQRGGTSKDSPGGGRKPWEFDAGTG